MGTNSGTSGTKEIATRYPIAKGLTARTQSQTGRITNLVPLHSLVQRRFKEGLD